MKKVILALMLIFGVTFGTETTSKPAESLVSKADMQKANDLYIYNSIELENRDVVIKALTIQSLKTVIDIVEVKYGGEEVE